MPRKKAVYFVGAGLTKSLQREERVPLMDDFVHVAAAHVETDDVILQMLAEAERRDGSLCLRTVGVSWVNVSASPAIKWDYGPSSGRIEARPLENIERVLIHAHQMTPPLLIGSSSESIVYSGSSVGTSICRFVDARSRGRGRPVAHSCQLQLRLGLREGA
jgi:hypothetical protein